MNVSTNIYSYTLDVYSMHAYIIIVHFFKHHSMVLFCSGLRVKAMFSVHITLKYSSKWEILHFELMS